MAWLHLTCHHYCRPTNPGGLYDLRVNISWRHLIIAWKVLASVVLRMPPLLSGTRYPSPSSVPSPLTFSRAIWRHICLISHIHNCDVTFLSYCVFPVWYQKRFWAWRLVAVEIGAIENWHYYIIIIIHSSHPHTKPFLLGLIYIYIHKSTVHIICIIIIAVIKFNICLPCRVIFPGVPF